MRICSNCGHVLEDGEEVCRTCGSDLIIETDDMPEEAYSLPADVSVSSGGEELPVPDETATGTAGVSLFTSSSTVVLEIPSPSAETDGDTEPETEDAPDPLFTSSDRIVLEIPASAEPGDSDTEPEAEDVPDPLFTSPDRIVLEIPADTGTCDSGSTREADTEEAKEEEALAAETDAETAETEADDAVPAMTAGDAPAADNYRVVNVAVRNDDRLKGVNRERVAIVVIALLALISVISAVFMIVVPLVRAKRQDEAAKEAAYLDYLTGEWLSETFIYSGEQYPSCELLTIKKDSTFVSEILTSPNDRETYDPETWTLTARQSGDLHIEVATSSLRVSYTGTDGNVMVYRRYILKLDSSSLILREYYNEKMTDYYDVIFTRTGDS